MAIVIFHSIKLASLFAFNSMNPSILIIIDLSHFRGQFLPAIYNFVKQTNKQKRTNTFNVGLISFS